MESKSIVILICGESGSGKTTICDMLEKNIKNISRIKTCTTRNKRENEPDDSYYFLTEDDYKKDLDSNNVFESSEISGYKYWSKKDSILINSVSLWVVDVYGFSSIPVLLKENKFNCDVIKIYLNTSRTKISERLRKEGIPENVIKERINRTIVKVGNASTAKALSDYEIENNGHVSIAFSNILTILKDKLIF